MSTWRSGHHSIMSREQVQSRCMLNIYFQVCPVHHMACPLLDSKPFEPYRARRRGNERNLRRTSSGSACERRRARLRPTTSPTSSSLYGRSMLRSVSPRNMLFETVRSCGKGIDLTVWSIITSAGFFSISFSKGAQSKPFPGQTLGYIYISHSPSSSASGPCAVSIAYSMP